MLAYRNTTRIAALIMALATALCLCAVGFSGSIAAAAETGVSMEYETALFDTDTILRVNIIMEEADWADMLENAISETYYSCDVEIGGQTFYRVGIRPKGNTSLSSIANDPTTDRYSFKLEFDQYVDGQTCFGLDKLVLNNNYADATNMKEALIYDMFAYLGADASLYNYAEVSVNGEYWGVYLALEAVEDSFLLRNYGVQNGELYKPEGMNIGGGGGGNIPDMGNMDFGNMDFGNMDFENMDFSPFSRQENTDRDAAPQQPDGQSNNMGEMPDMTNMPDMGEVPDMGSMPNAGEMPDMTNMPDMSEMPDMTGFGGFSSGGADLSYTDDELDSYATIWDGEITKTKDADHKRVVTALKNIAEGTQLEKYMDVDNLLRYMAVHIFSVNEDSLSGSMAHNYYLYETDGRLNILPWDYNLALGGMNGGDAQSVVNSPIDDAFSSTDFFDTLMENETYHAQYYAYLQQLVEYIQGGAFDAFYTRVRAQIDTLVATDPTAFYSAGEYETAADTLYQLVKLRGQSIAGQVEGTIPSTEAAQRGADGLVEANGLDVSAMGVMNMGGGRGGADFSSNREDAQTAFAPEVSGESGTPDNEVPQMPGENGTPDNEVPQIPGENGTSDNDTPQMPGQGGGDGNRAKGPSGNFANAGQNAGGSALSTVLLLGISFAVMLAALGFAILFRRRRQ